jgi:hypothetical protein
MAGCIPGGRDALDVMTDFPRGSLVCRLETANGCRIFAQIRVSHLEMEIRLLGKLDSSLLIARSLRDVMVRPITFKPYGDPPAGPRATHNKASRSRSRQFSQV